MGNYRNSVDLAFQVPAAMAKGVTTTLPRGIPVASILEASEAESSGGRGASSGAIRII